MPKDLCLGSLPAVFRGPSVGGGSSGCQASVGSVQGKCFYPYTISLAPAKLLQGRD